MPLGKVQAGQDLALTASQQVLAQSENEVQDALVRRDDLPSGLPRAASQTYAAR
jgi:hypothetical protein